jgi:hypothetical protein
MATKYWLGAGVPIPEVQTITVAGTWATADTGTVTINGKTLTLTVGTDSATTDVAAALAAMIAGSSAIDDETRSALGTSVGEFAKLTAVVSGSTVVLTGPANGRPIGTVTVGETTTGDGELSVAVTTAGQGPYNWDTAANWSGGTVPTNADDAVFDHQAVSSCRYNLSQTSLTLASLTVTDGFRFAVGLPEVNSDSARYTHDENLPTYLALSAATVVTINGSRSRGIKLDTGSAASTIVVSATGQEIESGIAPVSVKANHASSSLSVSGGTVGLNDDGTAGQVTSVSSSGRSTVTIGTGVTVATITANEGVIVAKQAAATTINCYGGTVRHEGSGTVGAANVGPGTLVAAGGGTYTQVYQSSGIVDASQDPRAKTFTNYNMYGKSTFRDPSGVVTLSNGIKIHQRIGDMTLDLPARKTLTIGAI